MLQDFFISLIRIHILHHAAQRPWYGSELKQELEEHGYRISYGTLYPVLHEMETDGLLCREDRGIEGRIRKYYQITAAGRELLEGLRSSLKELVQEVLDTTEE